MPLKTVMAKPFLQKRSYRRTRKQIFTKTGDDIQTSHSAYCIFGTVYYSLQDVPRVKSKTKATLKHSTLKGTMICFFCKALLKSALRKDQWPPLLVQEKILRICSFWWNNLKHCWNFSMWLSQDSCFKALYERSNDRWLS